jgi:FkbM family methyltransferase
MNKSEKKNNRFVKINYDFELKYLIFYSIKYLYLFFFKILRKKQFIPIFLPFFLKQYFYDRLNKKFMKILIRDYTDWTMVNQIFINEDYNLKKFIRYKEIFNFYKNLVKNNITPLIIDCGGHIGLAAKYFSIAYPNCRIISIEPDYKNFKLAKKNCKDSINIEILNNAIGSDKGKCSIYDPKLGGNALRINRNHKGDINIISINDILKKNKETPFIIKIDIEGFENDLFSNNTEWIDLFPVIIIELHDWMLPKKLSSKNFLSLISKKDRDFIYSGENIFSISNTLLN